MFWIHSPRTIVFGENAVMEVSKYAESPILIVTGGRRTREIVSKMVEPVLEVRGFDYQVVGIPSGEPNMEVVEELSKQMIKYSPKTILAVGGGSVIDAAKASWIFYEHPELEVVSELRRFYENPFTLPTLRSKALLIAAETTSGTGSSVSRAAVIRDDERRVKMPILDYKLCPDVAIFDPQLTITMPKDITAYSGMDALTHAIEAYVGIKNNDFAEYCAIRAVDIAVENLPKAYANGDNLEARKMMHLANMYAGLAFSQKGTGLAHSISHVLGARYGYPHGLLNASLLPYVIDFNAISAEEKYAEIATIIGLEASTMEDLIVELIFYLNRLNERLAIPSIDDLLEEHEDDLNRNIDDIVRDIMRDPTIRSNPRKPSIEDLKKLLRSAAEGEFNFYSLTM